MAITLKAKKRENLSRSTTKQLRKDGYIPGVVYGKSQEPITVSVNNIDLIKTIRDEGRNAIISLEIEDEKSVDVMVHDYQKEIVKDDIIHVDFFAVDMAEEMDVQVPVRIEGEAIGVKEGGVLQQPIFELQVRAKPADIPEEITVDVTNLNIGDSLAVQDIEKTGNYEILDDPETTVVVILAPDTDDVEADTDVDESIEPELVGAKDDEEEQE